MDFLKHFLDRLREPSTYLGAALAVQGVGSIAKAHEAPAIADALNGVGHAVASGADPVTAGIMALAGIAGVFLKEKGWR